LAKRFANSKPIPLDAPVIKTVLFIKGHPFKCIYVYMFNLIDILSHYKKLINILNKKRYDDRNMNLGIR
jgi:hypothetical protein